ncbi:MAG TPA: LptF/LptG family permease [Verrucomicrobiae bacterium]
MCHLTPPYFRLRFTGELPTIGPLKTLHLYLTRQVFAALVMTVVVFTFVLLLGNALKEILPLLISGQIQFGAVAQAVGLLVPFVWVFALPMGMLTATLLIFGRFSADQEYTAVRASGVSLMSLVSPVLLLSIALCGVSALLNMEIGPRCRVAYTSLRSKLAQQLLNVYLPEHTFIKDFPGYIFYVGKNRNGQLQDILIFTLKNETNAEYRVRAPRGLMQVDVPNKKLTLTLYDAKMIPLGDSRDSPMSGGELLVELKLEAKDKGAARPNVDDMTFSQLTAELSDLEQRLRLPVPLKTLTPEQRQARRKEWEQLRKDLGPVVFNMHRQVAYSFACFGFTLVGIPLGIRVHRRETNIGIAIALVLVAVYYSFILIGQSLTNRPEFLPNVIVWIPNFLFQAVGAVLLWRANRG